MKKLLQKLTTVPATAAKISTDLPVQPLSEQESSELSGGFGSWTGAYAPYEDTKTGATANSSHHG